MAETLQLETPETGIETPVERTRPEGVPEKFWDSEKGTVKTDDVLKSYKELEKKLGETHPIPNKQPEESPAIEASEANVDEATVIAEDAGIDVEKLSQEFEETGKISNENYQKLEQRGISRELVDEFIQSRQERAEATRAEVFKEVGGEEAYKKIVSWAAQNWDEQKIAAFNATMETNNPEQWKLAASGLKAAYDHARGVHPKFVSSTSTSMTAGEKFESFAQLLEAQKDPRYAKDPAFRAQVKQKLKNSNI